ncbi:MAG: phage tail-collar fiber domain-containing protein, partial [Methylomonas sp.]
MAFITVAGENQIAAKQGAAQTLDITHFVLAYIAGLGAEPANRIEAMPAAGNIKATLPVTSSGYVNGNQVVYSLVMDSSLGDYDFNWVGLKDADGVLIACTYTPLIQKRKTTGAIPGNNLTRNFLIAFSGIQATTAIAVPAATWQIDFNARLWGIDERERLSNYDIYGHEAFIGTGWKIQRVGATTTYDVLPGVGYVGGVRIASAVVQPVTVAGPPKSVWVDISLQGD